MHILYCERISTPYFFEPLNTVSNLAFIMAAYYSFSLIKRSNTHDPSIKLLPYVITAIGLGSMSFHSFRSEFTNYLDIIPILIFMLLSVYTILQKTFRNVSTVKMLFILFGIVQIASYYLFRYYIYGIVPYVITLTLLIILGIRLYKQHGSRMVRLFVPPLLSFFVALVFRNMEFGICSSIQTGTHFLWHIFAALTTLLTVRLLVNLKINSLR